MRYGPKYKAIVADTPRGVFWTGGAVNPARALAPCIVKRSFPNYHWIYWVGPTAGVFVAVVFYKLVKALEYNSAQEQDEYTDSIIPLLPRATSRKPSSIIPLVSVYSSSERSVAPPENGKEHLESIKTPVSTPTHPEIKKEGPSVLPDCTAD